MGLADDQRRFTELLSLLLQYGNSRPGYRVRLRDAGRSKEEQQRMVAIGASKTLDSAHGRYCAADLVIDVWENSHWVTSWNGIDYEPLGRFWKGLDDCAKWGGDWDRLRDYGHFEYGP